MLALLTGQHTDRGTGFYKQPAWDEVVATQQQGRGLEFTCELGPLHLYPKRMRKLARDPEFYAFDEAGRHMKG